MPYQKLRDIFADAIRNREDHLERPITQTEVLDLLTDTTRLWLLDQEGPILEEIQEYWYKSLGELDEKKFMMGLRRAVIYALGKSLHGR